MTSMRRWMDFGRSLDAALLLGVWLLMVAGMLYGYRDAIADFLLPDPDDALRLVQVRDFLAGQPWYDLTQYRINPAGGGGQVHWSRFVDAQIAALILLIEPFLSTIEAERWAITVYPLLMLVPLLLVFRALLGRLGDANFVRTGLLLAATTFSFLHYFVPLRIDHHNWQLLLSLVILWLALGPATFARGLAAALVIALHVEISLEGLPYLVIFGGLFALDWLRDPASAPRLRGFMLGVAVLPPLWIVLMRGIEPLAGAYCDSFSRPYVAGAMVAGLIVAGAMSLPLRAELVSRRVLVLGIAAAAGAIVFVFAAPECLAGPFGNLSPLVREYWYEGISEGMPIWKQSADIAFIFAGPSIIGLGLLIASARRMAGTAQSIDWWRYVFVAGCSVILSLLVLRATAATHAIMVPGYVLLAQAVFRWGRSFASPLQRIPATAMIVMASPMAVSATAVAITMPFSPSRADELPTYCINPDTRVLLNQLPASTFFVPLDIAPAILVGTRHSVVASGHHRNHRAMHDVIEALMASSDRAEAIVRRTGAGYLALCRNMPEYKNFVVKAKQGLTAKIDQGEPPKWLAFEPAHSKDDLLVYRVLAPMSRTKPQ